MIQQKVVHKVIFPYHHLEEWLIKEGIDGWRLTDITTVITNKGAAMYSKQNGYYFDDCLFLFNKSDKKYTYKCVSFTRRCGNSEEIMENINNETAGLNAENFELIKILAPGVIGSLQEYPTKGSLAYIMIFIREDG